MRENEPVLLVLSVCDGEIILEKGEILCEKCQAALGLFRPSSTNGTGYNDKKILLFCFSCSFGSTGGWIRKGAELARALQRVTG